MPSHDAEQTRRKIASLESETGWYQCIDLGQGIRTKTKSHWGEPLDYPMPTWRAIRRSLPDDLQG